MQSVGMLEPQIVQPRHMQLHSGSCPPGIEFMQPFSKDRIRVPGGSVSSAEDGARVDRPMVQLGLQLICATIRRGVRAHPRDCQILEPSSKLPLGGCRALIKFKSMAIKQTIGMRSESSAWPRKIQGSAKARFSVRKTYGQREIVLR